VSDSSDTAFLNPALGAEVALLDNRTQVIACSGFEHVHQ
jgi:hypothetical protein